MTRLDSNGWLIMKEHVICRYEGLLEGPWDRVTTYNWAYKPSYNKSLGPPSRV